MTSIILCMFFQVEEVYIFGFVIKEPENLKIQLEEL